MFRILFLPIISICFALSANASEPSAEFWIKTSNVTEMQRLVEQLDGVDDAKSEPKNDQLRAVFKSFATTDPETIEFIHKWQKTYPNSIYAKAAMAKHLTHVGWLVRGHFQADSTYIEAFNQMTDYMSLASSIAHNAYLERPDFVPVSDSILELRLNGQGQFSLQQLAQQVMTLNPNIESLRSIVFAATPKWGGSRNLVKSLCDAHSPKISGPNQISSDMCYAEFVLENPHAAPNDVEWALDVLDDASEAQMKKVRFLDALYYRPDQKGAREFVLQAFDVKHKGDVAVARHIEQQFSLPGFLDKAIEQRRNQVTELLQSDMYNVDLLEEEIDDLQKRMRANPSEALRVEFNAMVDRAMVYGKYRPNLWVSKIEASLDVSGKVDPLQGLEWTQNAVRYSNYRPQYVSDYFANLSGMYQHYGILAKSQPEVLGKDEPNFRSMVKRLECPAVRSARLLILLCGAEAAHNRDCRGSENSVDQASAFFDKALQKNMCPSILHSHVDGLFFAQDSWLEKS